MKPAEALYHLQEIDLLLLKYQRRLTEIQSLLGNDSAIRAAQKTLEQTQSKLTPLLKQQKELDHQLLSVQTKRKGTEDRLYSGVVKVPKELQDMQHEIEALKRRNAELEDIMLNLMLDIETATEAVNAANTQLEAVRQDRAHIHQDLFAEQDHLTAEVAKLEQRRNATLPTIAPDHLTVYEQLKPRKAHRPIAVLQSDTSCGVCGIQQNATIVQNVRKGDALVTCHNCQRILVYLA